MNIGMLGLQGAGKKTLFKLLTGSVPPTIPAKGLPGKFSVLDPRVDRLHEMYKPEKTRYARMDVLLLPDVEKTEGKAGWLDEVRNMDGLVCVVRAFEDPTVYHPSGTVDAMRDLELFMSELLFADLVLLEKRAEKLKKELRIRRDSEKEAEQVLVDRISKELEAGGNTVLSMSFSEAERQILTNYQFLTAKPVILVVNIAQGDDSKAVEEAVRKTYGEAVALAVFDSKLEAEIAEMSDAAERAEFLDGMGITEPAVAQLTRVIYDRMGLMSYFTVGTDEVRAWTIRKNSTAPAAARAIHSDLERGFIRAEHMKYEHLLELGSEAAVKEAGKASLKGKEYIVEDGDILSFRSSP